MNTPDVVVVCLQVSHPPDFLHVTVIVLPVRVTTGVQSGLFGSAFVQAHDTVVVTPVPPCGRLRAVTITVDVTSRCPGRSTMRLARGGDVRRRGCLARRRCPLFIIHPPLAGFGMCGPAPLTRPRVSPA
jgi:hypothetical protein